VRSVARTLSSGDIAVTPTTTRLSFESIPMRTRGTGFVDGVGHIGGALAVPSLGHLSPLGAFGLIAAFQALAAILVRFAPMTRDQLSP